MVSHLKECHHSLHRFITSIFHVFFVIHFDSTQQTTEVNNDTLITKTDRIRKRESRKKKTFPTKTNNYEKLNTRFHPKFPAAILKNPYLAICFTNLMLPMLTYQTDYYFPSNMFIIVFTCRG